MSILSFVSSLVRSIGKEDIFEDIRITRKELSDKLIPLFIEADKYFKTHKFQSKEIESLNAAFTNIVNRGDKYKNMIDAINQRLPMIIANLDQLSSELDNLLETKSLTDALTYKKAVMIKAVDLTSFFSIYSFKLLTYIYHCENREVNSGYTDLTMPAPLIKRIESNIGNYARIFKEISDKPDKFYANIKSLKDLPLDKKSVDAINAFDDSDPISAIALTPGFEGSPIYHYRLMISEWQANRYKLNKETKQYLELKLMNLRLNAEKKEDPKIEKEIEYLAGRIEKLDYTMAKQEKSVGGLE